MKKFLKNCEETLINFFTKFVKIISKIPETCKVNFHENSGVFKKIITMDYE